MIKLWGVLKYIQNNHNADIGISWDTIRSAIDELYPEQDGKDNGHSVSYKNKFKIGSTRYGI